MFIRGFRAKRIFFRTRPIQAAAEPLPDDPDNSREDEIQVTRIPNVSEVCLFLEAIVKGSLKPWYQHRDPLIGILDYIVEVRPPSYERSLYRT